MRSVRLHSLVGALVLWLHGCGCNDIGCADTVTVVADAAVDSVELMAAGGWVVCPSPGAATCTMAKADGRSSFTFVNITPAASMPVRGRSGGMVVFEGPIALTLQTNDPNGSSCEGQCQSGHGML